jgi:hypothetical protein
MGKAVVRGAGRGIFAGLVVLATLTFLPAVLLGGGDLYEIEDSLLVMGVPLALLGAGVGAAVAHERFHRAQGGEPRPDE